MHHLKRFKSKKPLYVRGFFMITYFIYLFLISIKFQLNQSLLR